MSEVTYLAPAKINLFLHITSKRPDGHHNLQTIFQLLDYYDEITFRLRSDGAINRIYGNESIPTEQDLSLQSAKILKKHSGTTAGIDIGINKKIPVGGGLGGGSSNAATVLIALNKIWSLDLPKNEIFKIGQTLGADVPVFINGYSSWAEGTGDILTPVNLPRHFYLVVSINKHISTKEIFSHKALTMSPVQRKISDFSLLSNLHNDCLDAAIDLENDIKEALSYLDSTKNHLGNAKMTGSGCCVFVAFERKKDAVTAKQGLPSQWFGFIAQAIDKSPSHNWDVAKR